MIRSIEATIVLTESPCCFQVGKSSWSPWPCNASIRASKREEAGDAGAWEAAVSAGGEKPWKKCTIKGYRMQQLVVLLLLLLDLPVMGTELFSSSIMILRFITWSCFRVWGLYCSRISRIFLSFQNVASVRFSAFKYVHLVFNVENRKGKPKEPKLKVVVHWWTWCWIDGTQHLILQLNIVSCNRAQKNNYGV